MSRAGWILVAAAALLVSPVIPLLTAPMAYFPLVERWVRSATGFDVALGDASVELLPLTLSLRRLEVANPRFSAPLLSADRASVTARVRDLAQGAPAWWRGSASGVDVRLEQDAQGNSNWTPPVPGDPAPPAEPNRALQFSVVELSDVSVTRSDPQASRAGCVPPRST